MCFLLYPKDFFSGLFTSPRAAMVSDTDTPKIPFTWVVLWRIFDSYKIIFYMADFLVV